MNCHDSAHTDCKQLKPTAQQRQRDRTYPCEIFHSKPGEHTQRSTGQHCCPRSNITTHFKTTKAPTQHKAITQQRKTAAVVTCCGWTRCVYVLTTSERWAQSQQLPQTRTNIVLHTGRDEQNSNTNAKNAPADERQTLRAAGPLITVQNMRLPAQHASLCMTKPATQWPRQQNNTNESTKRSKQTEPGPCDTAQVQCSTQCSDTTLYVGKYSERPQFTGWSFESSCDRSNGYPSV